jgi:hypothetical protein
MKLYEFTAGELVNLLSEKIRKMAWSETANASDFQLIHRSSRMCYELLLEKRLTMVDRKDAQILYDLPLDHRTEWLNRILNQVRMSLRDTGDISITAADHFAKSISMTMSS